MAEMPVEITNIMGTVLHTTACISSSHDNEKRAEAAMARMQIATIAVLGRCSKKHNASSSISGQKKSNSRTAKLHII